MVSRLHQLTIEQFDELITSGQFEGSRQRVDLLNGELRFKSPAGPFHDDILTYLED